MKQFLQRLTVGVLGGVAPALVFAGTDFLKMPEEGEVLTPQTQAVQYRQDVVRMGISRFSYPNTNYGIIYPTIQALQSAFGEDHFYAEVISGEDVDAARFDLILGSAGTYRRFTHRGTRDIASLVSTRFPDPNRAEGAVFAVLKTFPGEALKELKGKRLISTGPQAFSGFQVAMGELRHAGFAPQKFFSETVEVKHDMLTALAALREGQGDAAIFRTCFLEDLKASGADISDIKVVNSKIMPGFACRTSTRLYPNWTVFLTPHASPEVAKTAASTLLSLQPGVGGLSWTVATDFVPVDELFRELRIGPYDYLQRWSLVDFLKRYWEWFVFLVAVVSGLIWHSVRTDQLVTLRTKQLKEAWRRENELKARSEAAARYLAVIQRRSLIGQMSSMIAHELRQPLATIVNYTQGMLRLLDGCSGKRDEMLVTGIAVVQSEARKADGIVGKVRTYARKQQAETDRGWVDLVEILKKAAQTLTALNCWKTPLVLAPGAAVWVWADPLELEVAAVNLLKNALEAAESAENGKVSIAVTEEAGSGGTEAVLMVANPAPLLTEAGFERLSGLAQTTKVDGLGLGLSIVRSIADSHAGRLLFVRTAEDGVRAELRLPVKGPTSG